MLINTRMEKRLARENTRLRTTNKALRNLATEVAFYSVFASAHTHGHEPLRRKMRLLVERLEKLSC